MHVVCIVCKLKHTNINTLGGNGTTALINKTLYTKVKGYDCTGVRVTRTAHGCI